ncbi:acyltransferase [Pseudomonas yamanorum]|uniref:Acyltransferase n=2 Tax=Pseudomonas TaxID=286 RepID=A0A7Y8ED08_9PSED|nr:acyltransferase [Pseudomonas yamanorum]NWE12403.1 acyltransferase [Pseudomonas yamanorum]
MQRIAFANTLRGVASLSVLLLHYVLMINYMQGSYAGLSSLPGAFYHPWLVNSVNFFSMINLGAFGVSLFFLISGFVIPFSVSSFASKNSGRTRFFINRVFRIWPTYAVGFAVSLAALEIASYVSGTATSYTLGHLLAHVSLFRDWTGYLAIDGVVWTLEVEAKFYLFMLVFWGAIANQKLWPIAVLCIAMVFASRYGVGVSNPDTLFLNILFPIKYLFFMCIGIVFNYHYRGTLTTEKLFAISIFMIGVFSYVCAKEKWADIVLIAYISSFVLFTIMYLFARDWTGGRVFSFLADISFPLYACHAAMGYVGIRLMVGWGLPSALALLIATALALVLSWCIHIVIENPSHRLGKRIASSLDADGTKAITKERSV